MNLHDFTESGEPRWQELRALVAPTGARVRSQRASDVLRLAQLYRMTTADLARARRDFPGEEITVALEELVSQSRAVVYRRATPELSVRDLILRAYWREVRSRPVPLVVAALLLLFPMLIVGAWAHDDPVGATRLLPDLFAGASTGPANADGDLGLALDQQASFASGIFVNNIRVSFLAYAGGVTLGVGTAAVLVYNGAMAIGLLGGFAIGLGVGERFFELVAPHGFLELSLIIVAGAAGLRLGWSIVEPGTRTRAASVAAEARASVVVVLGTAAWLVVAGLVEGFVTPRALGVGPALVVGGALAVLYWALVLILGRPLGSSESRP